MHIRSDTSGVIRPASKESELISEMDETARNDCVREQGQQRVNGDAQNAPGREPPEYNAASAQGDMPHSLWT